MKVEDAVVVVHRLPGRLRLRLRSRPNPGALHAVERALVQADGVLHVRVNESAASVVVEYDPARQSPQHLLALLLDDEQPFELRARIEETLLVQSSPDQVWAVLGEPGRAAMHLPSVLQIQSEGPQSWRVTLDLLGQPLQGRVLLVSAIPAERLELTLEGAVQGRYLLSLAPYSNGTLDGTLVREQVWYDLSQAVLDITVGRLAEPAIRRLVRRHLISIDRLLVTPAAGGIGASQPGPEATEAPAPESREQ